MRGSCPRFDDAGKTRPLKIPQWCAMTWPGRANGVEEVFDATVLGTHNFVANGIAVHNSIEQDADMVILLHREAAYERDSPREGEADLIVAKHRNGPTGTIVVAFQGHFSRFTNMASNS